jgi:hypothetical protein
MGPPGPIPIGLMPGGGIGGMPIPGGRIPRGGCGTGMPYSGSLPLSLSLSSSSSSSLPPPARAPRPRPEAREDRPALADVFLPLE